MSLTDIQYFYNDPDIEKLKIPLIKGTLTLEKALEIALYGTGYSATFSDVNTFIIKKIPPLPLEEKVNPVPNEQIIKEEDPALEKQYPLTEIKVTTPRTTALGFKKISPTTVIEGSSFRNSGNRNIAFALYDFPAMTATRSEANTTYNKQSTGVNMLDLRDLGVVRTLVTVNGRRHVPTGSSDFNTIAVDINVLPAGLIDRVEIITTGTSVLFGADALAGLVNITLRDNYEGLDISVLGNLSQQGDNGRYNISSSFGKNFADDRAHYMAFINIQKYDGLKNRDRFISNDPAGFALNGVPTEPSAGGILTRGFGRARGSASGTIVGYADENGNYHDFLSIEGYAVSSDGKNADFYNGSPEQRYNWTDQADLISPKTTAVYSGNFLYELGDHHRFFFEHTLARSQINKELAPAPINAGTLQRFKVPIDNPFIPVEIKEGIITETDGTPSGIFLERRLTELGNRKNRVTRNLLRIAFGVEGELWRDWQYSLYYQYGITSNHDIGQNYFNFSNLLASTDPDLCINLASEGCQLINYFGQDSITDEQVEFLRTGYKDKSQNQQSIIAFKGQGDILQTIAGPISASFGIDYRKESSSILSDPLTQQGLVGGAVNLQSIDGSFHVFDTYIALSVPLFSQNAFGHSLTFDVGLRTSDFSTIGNLESFQGGFDYQPISSINIRASYQEANRAPNLSELYSPNRETITQYIDPCNIADPNLTNQTTVENCRSQRVLGGVPSEFYQSSIYVNGNFSGNSSLVEENASTKNIGATFQPILSPKYGRFYFSVDWFNIKVENFIHTRDIQDLLNHCYQSSNLSSVYCGNNFSNGEPYFTRNPITHEINQINLSTQNGGVFENSGIDTEIIYTQKLSNLGFASDSGEIQFRALYSYNLKSEMRSDITNEKLILRNSIRLPKHKFLFGLTYENKNILIKWQRSLRSSSHINNGFPLNTSGNRAPSIAYDNVIFNVTLNKYLKLQTGIENIFNKKPPFLAFNLNNTFPEYYDVVGRRFFFGFNAHY